VKYSSTYVSQAPSPGSNPNSPLPVDTMVGLKKVLADKVGADKVKNQRTTILPSKVDRAEI
jgi:hypothetical protein